MLLFDGVSFAVLEVEPSEVLIRSPEQQERQEQQLNGSSSSDVVREALFSCLQVSKMIHLMTHAYQSPLSDSSAWSTVYQAI